MKNTYRSQNLYRYRGARFGVREGRFPWFVGGAWGTVEISGGVPKIGMVAGSVDVDKIESREL